MAQSQNVQAQFAELHRLGQNGGYGKALKVANKILQELPQDEKAFQCKIVCLIQLNRFEEALAAIKKSPQAAKNLHFEKGYCEYRLFRSDDALQTLQAVENPDLRVKELLAQVMYRQERYQESFDLYKDLMKNTQDDLDEERETNLSAAMAALQTWQSQDVEDLGLQEATYEQCFNRACYLMGRGQYKEAMEKLHKAEALCKEMFEDDQDVTQDEIESELAVIRVQMGYAFQKMSKSDEAMKLYNMVAKQKPSDIGAGAVASNNIVSLNKDQNVFDSKKKMKAATADGLAQKLTSAQQKVIAMNQCLLYMYTNQGDMCQRTAKKLSSSYPESDTPVLIHAAQHCRDKHTEKAVKLLQEHLSKNGDSITTRLTLAQLFLSKGQISQACEQLRNLGDLSQRPGVVSTLVKLYVSIDDKGSASDVLNEAVEWYQDNEPNSKDLMVLVRANANFQLRHGSPETACKMLEEMRRVNPDDLKIVAQLINAYSKFDPKKAQEISRELPSPAEMAQSVDVAALEATVTTLKYKKVIKAEQQSPKPQSPKMGEGDLIQKKQKKKKRKVKLPKTCEADGNPDPERWTPLRERTYYRGKRKNKKRDVGKGTQGAAPAGPDIDASSPPGSQVSSPKPGSTAPAAPPGGATAASSQPTPPKPPKGQAAKSKKKKRGGKW